MLKKLTIWVLWWSWRTWWAVITESLIRWHSVITLVRSPEKILQSDKNLIIIKWDATKKEDIHPLLEQVDVLIDTVSVPFFHTTKTTLYSQVSQAIITARDTWSTQQLIVMSSAWTHHGRRLPRPASRWYELFLGDVADNKETTEEMYTQSSLPRTIIKAPLLTNWAKKNYVLSSFTNYTPSLFATISRKTVATCILDIAEEKMHIREKITPQGI